MSTTLTSKLFALTLIVAVSVAMTAGVTMHTATDSASGAARTAAAASGRSNQDATAMLRPITAGMRPKKQPAPAVQLTVFNTAAAAMSKRGDAFTPGTDVVIDVLIAYTRKAAASYMSIERELLEPAVAAGNLSFRLSGVGHVQLRLVHAYQTDYVEAGQHFDHIWRFADKGDGHMEAVHGLRDQHRADVAILIVDDANGCGQATRVGADADEAFAVVHHGCALSNYTLAHEIGHIIGASHDRGYVHGAEWRDIMSYKARCGGCPRLPVWSSPAVLVHGHPAGTAELDNARVIAEQAPRVATFR